MKFTILGASGFIGSNMCRFLQEKGIEHLSPNKDFLFSKDINLGHVIYCIGLTSDFRIRPMDTVKAHVCKLVEVLENSRFDSFTYLSSTRVYLNSRLETKEMINLVVNPNEAGDLYNISKLMGESICLSFPGKAIKIVRLSNVLGDYKTIDNFLSSILHEIKTTDKLKLHSSLNSEKDYIAIEDVITLLYDISLHGKYQVYNIASGKNTTNQEIVEVISAIKNFKLEDTQSMPEHKFLNIDNTRIIEEFAYKPTDVLNKISILSKNFLNNN